MAENILTSPARLKARALLISYLDSDVSVIAMLIAHIGLGLLVAIAPSFARPLYIIIFGSASVQVLLYPNKTFVTAFLFYIAGSEVFWRATGSIIFWESGKYLVLLIIVIEIFRYKSIKVPLTVFAYLLMLLPAAIVTFSTGNFFEVREIVASNLAGPIVLAMSIWFFAEIKINRQQLKIFLVCLIAPTISLGIYALYGLLVTEDLTWTTESNWQASGGYGPNQVSASLGLGIIALFIVIVLLKEKPSMKALWFLQIIWITGQALLTFSRGGIFVATGISFVIALQVMRRQFFAVLIAALVIALAYQYLFPLLDSFTNNQLSLRLQDPSDSNRGLIMNADLQLFRENPLGLGVGLSKGEHKNILGFKAAAHNEYSRLLAEHGVLGLFAILIIGSKYLSQIFGAKSYQNRAIISGFGLWAIINMYINATRIVAIPVMFGVAFAQFELTELGED